MRNAHPQGNANWLQPNQANKNAKRKKNLKKKRKKKFKNFLVSCGTLGIPVQGTGKAHKSNLPSANDKSAEKSTCYFWASAYAQSWLCYHDPCHEMAPFLGNCRCRHLLT